MKHLKAALASTVAIGAVSVGAASAHAINSGDAPTDPATTSEAPIGELPAAQRTLHLPDIPSDATIKAEKQQGSGASEDLVFDTAGGNYTVAIACITRDDADMSIFDYAYPDAPMMVECDGVPTSQSVTVDPGQQRLQLRTSENTEWIVSIYGGTADGVTIID